MHLTVTSGGRTIHGLQLVYGPQQNGGPTPQATTIEELPRPDDPALWSRLGRGVIEIAAGQGSSSGGGRYRLWVGSVRSYGRYVTITSARGEQAVIEIARSLHPAG